MSIQFVTWTSEAFVVDISASTIVAVMDNDHLPKAYYRVLRFQARLPVLHKPTIVRIGDLFYANRNPPTEQLLIQKKVRKRFFRVHKFGHKIRILKPKLYHRYPFKSRDPSR